MRLRSVICCSLLGVLVLSALPAHAAGWSAASSMIYSRRQHAAVTLQDGRVLVVGGDGRDADGVYGFLRSAEIYDPASDTWTLVAPMTIERIQPTATALQDGRVLVIGGGGATAESATSAEIFNPATGSWSRTTPPPTVSIGPQTATLLADGRVLLVGGCCTRVPQGADVPQDRAEIYDPTTQVWTRGFSMSRGRSGHTATLLRDGSVFVFGGLRIEQYQPPVDGGEIYGPAADRWGTAAPAIDGDMSSGHTAAALADGKVLLVGGCCITRPSPVCAVTGCWTPPKINEPRLYDHLAKRWFPAGLSVTPRFRHEMVVLRNGRALVMGGISRTGGLIQTTERSAELFDPSTRTWSSAPSMSLTRQDFAATMLADGRVLVAGGDINDSANFTRRVEIFQP